MPIISLQDQRDPLVTNGLTIVGAGAVGIAIAVYLARRGIAVTLLEGGPQTPPADYSKANIGPNVGRQLDGLLGGRMKAFGGTTRLWGGQLVPFDAPDFQAIDQAGRTLWPIGYNDFLPWISAAYDLLGVNEQSRQIDKIWQSAAGQDPAIGHGLRMTMNIWLRQPDFTKLFASALANNPLIRVITDAAVQQLQFTADGRVDALMLLAADGSEYTCKAETIILANGTLEIARLLLKAQKLDPHCPFRENRHVGRWFMDHLHGLAGEIEVRKPKRLSTWFDNVYFDGHKYNVKIRQDASGRKAGGSNIAATINPRMQAGSVAREAKDLMLRLFGGRTSLIADLREGLVLLRIIAPVAWRYVVKRRAGSLFDQGVHLGLEIEQLPTWDSYLLLDPASPPETAPVGVHWHVDNREMPAIRQFCEAVISAFDESGIGSIKLDPRIVAEDIAFLDECHDANHQMGGARMADCRENGVVDHECRVFGSPNLYIAGAATFPSGSFANPTLSAIALGLRVAAKVTEAGRSRDTVISRLIFGTARLTGGASKAASIRMLDMVLDAGVRAIDCAPPYGMGTAEQVVGKALQRRMDGNMIEIIAKVGLPRPSHAYPKTWLRAIKRLVKKPMPANLSGWAPVEAAKAFGVSDFSDEALGASVARTIKNLGRFDRLLLHECGPDEYTPDVAKSLAAIAGQWGAQPGYAWGAKFDPTLNACFPADYMAECAIDPGILAGTSAPPLRPGILFHSVVPTMGYLMANDPAFSKVLEKAAEFLLAFDKPTARIAVTYALAAERAPTARFVFASNDPVRLHALLAAFQTIDRENLRSKIAALFA